MLDPIEVAVHLSCQLKWVGRYHVQRCPPMLPGISFPLHDRYSTPVPRVTGIAKDSNPDTVKCMMDNCKQEVIDCAKDSDCRACISCLTSCPPNDQVTKGVDTLDRQRNYATFASS